MSSQRFSDTLHVFEHTMRECARNCESAINETGIAQWKAGALQDTLNTLLRVAECLKRAQVLLTNRLKGCEVEEAPLFKKPAKK